MKTAKIFSLLAAVLLLSIACEQSTPSDFSADEVPTFIPFEANTHVKSPIDTEFLDYSSGYFIDNWCDKSYVTSSYFRVSKTGELNIALLASNTTGSGKVRFTINDKNYDITISGEQKIYGITTIDVEEAGYIQIDMQGLSYSGDYFAHIDGFRIGGEAASGDLIYVSEEELAAEASGAYFILRGPSTHWNYQQPEGDAEYFYNEVLVEEEDAIIGSYYMVCGFSGGYMGIQRNGEDEYRVLFSIWSPYVTDDPNAIPEEYEVKALRSGADVVVKEFGGEGSGGQSYWSYNWKPDTTYRCLVQVQPDNQGNTIYTGYFYADDKWNLIASFLRPKTELYCTGIYSFLESFYPATTIYSRKVHFTNQWVCLTSGEWSEITAASFSCDSTARSGHRYDYNGYVDQTNNSFVLRGFGFTPENTEYGTPFTREANGVAPVIDFEALDKL